MTPEHERLALWAREDGLVIEEQPEPGHAFTGGVMLVTRKAREGEEPRFIPLPLP